MEPNETNKWEKLLDGFNKIPKADTSPTLLEICRYPYHRFEEVCSRILKFFLDPKAEHELGDLWLTALLDVTEVLDLHNPMQETTVLTEEYANGKRIDLTILSESYVVAGIYNPLTTYKEYIEHRYKGKKRILLVLSAKPILNLHDIMGNEYRWCSYTNLFDAVRKRLGDHISYANHKYLVFMLNFMKTIDNMNNPNSAQEQKFFLKHRAEIEELLKHFNRFKEQLWNAQKEQIAYLKEEVVNSTEDNSWWIYQGWDLGIHFNEKGHRIGIESHFSENDNDPCAFFHIYVTTWNTADWEPYKETVMQRFNVYNPREEFRDNRVFVHLFGKIPGGDVKQIISHLKHVYGLLKEIASEIH